MGGRAGKGGGINRGDATMKGYSSGLAKAMKARQKEIQFSEDENVSIFDANGNEVFRAVGNENTVGFDGDLAENRITIHNHPENSTFSFGDVETAVRTNQSEMRVITKNGIVYSLKRPKKGWGISSDKLLDVANDVGLKVADEIARTGKQVSSIDEAFHMQWQALSKKMGWSYTKSRI